MAEPVRVGIAGLGFGAEFIPIYRDHPDAQMSAICQRSEESLHRIGDAFGIERRFTSFDDMIADPELDAVHINTPIPNHAEQSIAALRAGKHVACTVPMATTLDECRAIVDAARESGKNYMMMETTVFSREFLHVKELVRNGTVGRLQFLRGAHQQEMAGWPGYWEGLPPMHYATHAISPLLALADGALAEYVVCLGSGRISPELTAKYGSPFAVESALVKVRDSDLSAEITRSLFETARQYVESFSVYGDRSSFEWEQVQGSGPVLFTGEDAERIEIPDYAHLLPESIREYTTHGVYDATENQHLSFTQGSGHGGSHPHMAHEFVRSIVEDRAPFPDIYASANWTSAGICAHESAMTSREVELPAFSPSRHEGAPVHV